LRKLHGSFRELASQITLGDIQKLLTIWQNFPKQLSWVLIEIDLSTYWYRFDLGPLAHAPTSSLVDTRPADKDSSLNTCRGRWMRTAELFAEEMGENP
jgi:hypothetical protein